ncbi:MAG: hypothetical protein ABR549_07740 [Mycobacteriales bacterium]
MSSVALEQPRPSWPTLLGVFAVTGYLFGFSWAMSNAQYDVWGAFLVIPVLAILSIPLLRRAARDEPGLLAVLALGLIVKLLGSVALYALDQQVYTGSSDALGYADDGAVYADQLHAGYLHVSGSLWGTTFIGVVTGLLFYVTGPTALGGFLVFSWLGFWGLVLFYRAFVLAVPNGDGRRYARLLFFLPSLAFWSSTIGKEAWMTLALGLCAYGAARALTDRRGGLLLVAVGVALAALARPHIAPLALIAITLAYVVRARGQTRHGALRPLRTLVGITVLIIGCGLVITQAKDYLAVGGVDSKSIRAVVLESGQRSTSGGSSFHAHPVASPLDLPQAFVTVLFRPFATEAHNSQALASAAEGSLLLLLLVASWPRWSGVLRRLRQAPYVLVSLVTTLLFVYALSGYSNFGLLARQRVQVYPFFLVLLALPRPVQKAVDA